MEVKQLIFININILRVSILFSKTVIQFFLIIKKFNCIQINIESNHLNSHEIYDYNCLKYSIQIFKNQTLWKYKIILSYPPKYVLVVGYPRNLKEEYPDIPFKSVDSAFSIASSIFFFKGKTNTVMGIDFIKYMFFLLKLKI